MASPLPPVRRPSASLGRGTLAVASSPVQRLIDALELGRQTRELQIRVRRARERATGAIRSR